MSSEAFELFLDAMLPEDGCAVALAEVYMDESYDDKAPPILCVAGYVFRKQKAREFARGWANYLRRKNLPYFHMKEAAHAKRGGIFKGKPELALEVELELIKRTKAATEIGFASTINEDDYAELVAPREGMRTAYATALLAAMGQVRAWAHRTNFQGEIAYFFEAGHKHEGDADAFMRWLFASERASAKYRYAGHAFVPKRNPGVQPADLLAWQWRAETKRKLDPNRAYPPRKDLLALVRPHDMSMDWTRDHLEHVGAELAKGEAYRRQVINDVLAGRRAVPARPD